jgi:hypothetical protein
MYSTNTYLCISFGIRRCVRGAEEEDGERVRVFCACLLFKSFLLFSVSSGAAALQI